MGQGVSKQKKIIIDLPLGKNYIISYCRQYNIHEPVETREQIDLSKIIEENDCKNIPQLIYSVLYYKIKHLGYNTDNFISEDFAIQLPLNEILETILSRGIKSELHHENLNDLEISIECFYPKVKNIKRLLSMGNILIGGLILDRKLLLFLEINDSVILSDIVLIVGYNTQFIMIKTTWISEILNLPIEFIDNFKELWNINVKSPEDKFFAKISE